MSHWINAHLLLSVIGGYIAGTPLIYLVTRAVMHEEMA